MRTLASTAIAFMCWAVIACSPSVSDFNDNNGADAGPGGACTAGQTRCSGNLYQVCDDGMFRDEFACDIECHDSLGCVACNPDVSSQTCVGDAVHVCNADGSFGEHVETCPLEACDNGRCVDACADAASTNSYIGCEYWPVDLHNAVEVVGEQLLGGCTLYGVPSLLPVTVPVCYNASPGDVLAPTVAGVCDPGNDCSRAPTGFTCQSVPVCMLDAQQSPFAVVVSNPDATHPARVTIEDAFGGTSSVDVPAGGVVSVFPQSLGLPDLSITGPGKAAKAYRVTSTRPVVAYQFNPLHNVGVFSNDGSLLIPSHAYDKSYFAVTLETAVRRPDYHDYHGYITVVGSSPGTTTLMVTPTADTLAGPGLVAMTAGMTYPLTIEQWETLTIEAASGDLTGTHVESLDNPVGVFAGHVATAPSQNASPCCADHLEEQMFPASTWGKTYAIARSLPRGSEPDMLRIVAQKPNTTVTLEPPMAICPTLNPGEYCEAMITGDVEIIANEPIMVAHFLLATGNAGSGVNPVGDPAIAISPPTEQYRNDYTLLVPSQYAQNFLALVAPVGSAVSVNGTDVTGQLTSFASGEYMAGRVMVQQGQIKLSCSAGCGVELGGYDDAVSYLFAGGLDLKAIVID